MDDSITGHVTEYCRLGGHSTCSSRDCTCDLGTHVIYHEHGEQAAPGWRGRTRNLRLNAAERSRHRPRTPGIGLA